MDDPNLETLRPVGLGTVLFWARFHAVRNLRKRSFRLWALAVGLLVLALVAGARLPTDVLGSTLVISLAPLLSLWFGTGVLREEIEDQTLTYSFTRPVGRAWIYVARVLASAGPVLVLAVPAAAAAGLRAGPVTAGRFAAAAALSVLAYTGLFALLGLLVRRSTWFGLAFLLLWEGGVGQVPGFLGELTVVTHVRAIADLRPESNALATYWAPPATSKALVVLLAIVAVTLWLGGEWVRRRELRLER